jgi:hypothetical protein
LVEDRCFLATFRTLRHNVSHVHRSGGLQSCDLMTLGEVDR